MRTTNCPVHRKNEVASRPVYRPRRPRRSPLYQLLEDYFETFLLGYEEQYHRQYGPLRSEIKKTVYKFLDCGILEHGCESPLDTSRGNSKCKEWNYCNAR